MTTQDPTTIVEAIRHSFSGCVKNMHTNGIYRLNPESGEWECWTNYDSEAFCWKKIAEGFLVNPAKSIFIPCEDPSKKEKKEPERVEICDGLELRDYKGGPLELWFWDGKEEWRELHCEPDAIEQFCHWARKQFSRVKEPKKEAVWKCCFKDSQCDSKTILVKKVSDDLNNVSLGRYVDGDLRIYAGGSYMIIKAYRKFDYEYLELVGAI